MIKEVSVSVRKSKNYQTYECSEVLLVGEGDDVEALKKEAFNRCRAIVKEQLLLDEAEREEEVKYNKKLHELMTSGAGKKKKEKIEVLDDE